MSLTSRASLTDGRKLSFATDDDDLRHIDLAWSSTVHRAQAPGDFQRSSFLIPAMPG